MRSGRRRSASTFLAAEKGAALGGVLSNELSKVVSGSRVVARGGVNRSPSSPVLREIRSPMGRNARFGLQWRTGKIANRTDLRYPRFSTRTTTEVEAAAKCGGGAHPEHGVDNGEAGWACLDAAEGGERTGLLYGSENQEPSQLALHRLARGLHLQSSSYFPVEHIQEGPLQHWN